jgi:pimeloyl-ACP methyl ester carboxylesterase
MQPPSPSFLQSMRTHGGAPGEKKRLIRIWQTDRAGPARRRVEFMQFGADGLRPLVFLHSLEYPAAPAWGFCVDASEAGFGTLAIRRPGFGASEKCVGVEAQAELIDQFLEERGFDDCVLVAVGSACPTAYRLAASSPRIAFTAFVNCVFNRDIVSEFRPAWLGQIFSQAVQNKAGARLSLAAIRQTARRMGAAAFFEAVAEKSPGDLDFVRTFSRDIEAMWEVAAEVDFDTFRSDMHFSLVDDPFLTDGALSQVRGIALSGMETTPSWRKGFESEARRLGIATGYLPSGDLFAAYQSGSELLALLRDKA